MGKGNFFLIGLLINILSLNVAQSQTLTITVLDKSSNLALDNVTIMNLQTHAGTITNSEGKAAITIKDNTEIKISIINYEEQILKSDQLKKTDTIYLVPKVFQLDEVTVNSFDLSKALRYVIDNYSTLYDNAPFEKECDFKETIEIDGRLKRLIIAKVNWWDKSYERKKNEVKFRLGEISYYKNSPFDIFTDAPTKNQPSKSGHIVLSSVIETIYFNTLLNGLAPLLAKAKFNVEDAPSDMMIISFETDPIPFKNVTGQYKGCITFDKKSKAILAINYEITHRNDIEKKKINEIGKEYLVETKKSTISILFYKTLNDKLSLKTYEAVVNANVTYNKNVHTADFVNKIYVLNETNVKKVSNSGLIDLTKPIYDSLPSKEVKSTNGILLTDREKEFMFRKD